VPDPAPCALASALAFAAVARRKAPRFGLSDAVATPQAGLAPTVVDGQKVTHFGLERGWDSIA